MKITIKKVILIFISLAVLLTIYVFKMEIQVYMGRMIEIYVPIFNEYDVKKETHGGFHGDGETFITMQFSDKQAEKFIKKVKENEHWRELPFTGFFDNFVDIEHGYWFAIDRYFHNNDTYNSIKYNIDGIAGDDRAALNYTLAVFDTDNNMLYFYEMDT